MGSGGLGTVYAATHAPTGARVALKLGTCMVADEGSKWVLAGRFGWGAVLQEGAGAQRVLG